MSARTGLDHEARLASTTRLVGERSLDGLLVTAAIHVRYLTGFVGSAGAVLVTPGGSLLLTDDRYREQAEAAADAIADLEVGVGPAAVQRGAARARFEGRATVGLEADHVTWDAVERYRAEWFHGVDVVPTTGVVAGLRLVKEDAEIERIERAASITDDALAAVRHLLGTRPTERQFALALDRAIVDGGADDLSFDTIVASGPNAARPHHTPGDRVIERGDLVIVDVGALVDGYHSDMTRTFSIGPPGAEAGAMLDLVGAANDAGRATVAPGVAGDEVDAAARAVVDAAGCGSEFVHGVGHGVGLLIHEDPFLKGSDVPLVVGQVVTVEPGVYRSGFGGVRVEDAVVVTPDGCRPLTRSPKDPLVA